MMNYEKEIKKLEAQIEEAAARIEELKSEQEAKQEVPPVWKPDHGEEYYAPDDDDVTLSYPWYDDRTDNYLLKVGNVFKTAQEAEDYDRALTLIETIRRERYKAQGNWWPSEGESRCIMYWHQHARRINTPHRRWSFGSDVFGLWQDFGALQDVINKYSSELRWYFTEYLPSIN